MKKIFKTRRRDGTFYWSGMRRCIFIVLGLMIFCGSFSLAQQSIDSLLHKNNRKEWERRERERVLKHKASLSPSERKYGDLVDLVRKMKAEKAGSPANKDSLSKKYSDGLRNVDDEGRIRTILTLSWKIQMSDTLIVTQAIIKEGGRINYIFRPPYGHWDVEIDCWLPYNSFDKIVQLPNVTGTNILSVLMTGTRNAGSR
ncbi:MAG: hypothetical protein ACHQQQ_13870 [Bacteroidota bacterium]